MNRINLTKYGCVRTPEKDFSDDGSRFTCYSLGKLLRVSKTNYDGTTYISARIEDNKLPYDVYKALKHYDALDSLNGVNIATLTDIDVENFINNCLSFEAEYIEATFNFKYPAESELRAKMKAVQDKLQAEYDEVVEMLHKNTEAVFSLSEWHVKSIARHFKDIQSRLANSNDSFETRLRDMLNTASSVSYLKQPITDSWPYREIKEIVNNL